MSLPVQIQVRMRDLINGQWGPYRTGTATLPNGAMGTLYTREFDVLAGHIVSIPFVVRPGQKLSRFMAVNEELAGSTANKLHASISHGQFDVDRLREFSGRDTTTDEPFGNYQDKVGGVESEANRSVLELEPGTYWLNL